MLPVLRTARALSLTRTNPDWYLLDRHEFADLYEDAEIRDEKWMGLTKSIMAVKSELSHG